MATYDDPYRKAVERSGPILGTIPADDRDDSREDWTDESWEEYAVKEPSVVLPHQCGSWFIGGVEDALALAADLLEWAETVEQGEVGGNATAPT